MKQPDAIEIRAAKPEDIPELLPLLKEFSVFASKKYQLWHSEQSTTAGLMLLINSHPFFVATKNRKVIGCIAGIYHPYLFNPSLTMLTELLWWVSPQFRGSRAGALLLDTFAKWGKEHANLTIMTLEAQSPVNMKSLTKRGFVPHEQNFLLEV